LFNAGNWLLFKNNSLGLMVEQQILLEKSLIKEFIVSNIQSFNRELKVDCLCYNQTPNLIFI